jgi:hypothetical protein
MQTSTFQTVLPSYALLQQLAFRAAPVAKLSTLLKI